MSDIWNTPQEKLCEMLKKHLRVHVEFGRDYDPNTLTVSVYFNEELITADAAWINIKPEYEG